jgi:hypothetical protein
LTDQAAETHRCDVQDRWLKIVGGMPPIALVDWEDGEPQPRPWRLLGAQPSGPLAVALDRPTTDQRCLHPYLPGS